MDTIINIFAVIGVVCVGGAAVLIYCAYRFNADSRGIEK